jgi:hypothetical protein
MATSVCLVAQTRTGPDPIPSTHELDQSRSAHYGPLVKVRGQVSEAPLSPGGIQEVECSANLAARVLHNRI